MSKASRILTLTGAAALAFAATAASAHNPMTCIEFANLEGEMQRAAFNGLEPKSVQPELTNARPEMRPAGDPNASVEDNIFHKDLLEEEKIDIVLNTCSEGKYELVTDAVTEAMKRH